jgi:glycine/D-amino acid oxidase-like deaminating enzyme
VVVGGGAIGTSILFHLCEAGVNDAVLLERDQLGSGSTSKAAGGVRAQFSDELNIRIAQRSIRAFEDFGRRPGWEIELEQVGYLFLLTRSAEVEMFRESLALQRRLGVPSEMLSAVEAAELCPLIEPAGVLGATFCPTDGHATPEGVVSGYATAARALGGHIETCCALTAIDGAGERIGGVSTNKGQIATTALICAAGAWSRHVAALAGVDLPVTPLRRQVLFTGPLPGLPDRLPMTVDFTSSLYFHREGPGLLIGMSFGGEKPGFSTERSDDWMPELVAATSTPRSEADGRACTSSRRTTMH